jgi:hypothetical protein
MFNTHINMIYKESPSDCHNCISSSTNLQTLILHLHLGLITASQLLQLTPPINIRQNEPHRQYAADSQRYSQHRSFQNPMVLSPFKCHQSSPLRHHPSGLCTKSHKTLLLPTTPPPTSGSLVSQTQAQPEPSAAPPLRPALAFHMPHLHRVSVRRSICPLGSSEAEQPLSSP